MSHVLICGVTQSGKTTLAHRMAREFAEAGQNIVVYDPVGTGTAAGNWPANAIIFDNESEFMEYMRDDRVIRAHVFIDEAGDLFSMGQRENFWLLTRGRHFGLQIYLIAQRPKLLAPSVRGQCGAAYIFRLATEDAREIGRDFGHSGIDKIFLDKGDFLMLLSGSSGISRANIFNL